MTCAPSPPGSPAPTRTSPSGSWPPPAPDQWALTLAELRSEAHKTAATVRMVMSRALSFMADPALAACVLPAPGDGFDIPAFLATPGTVYLIAEAVSEEAPVAPLFAAMATEIHYDRRADRPGVARPGGWTRRC